MATEVSIKIRVDDAGVADTMSRVEQALTDAGVQGDASFRKLGQSGAAAGEAIGNGMHTASGHITTSLDAVRLLSQEFGLRIPRAMEAMLSRMPAVSSALSGLVGGLALVGAAEIFARIGEEAYHFYQRLTDVNAEVNKYLEAAGKQANDKLFDTASLETSVSLLQEANQQISDLEAKRRNAGVGADNSGSLKQYGTKYLDLPGWVNAAITGNDDFGTTFDKDDGAALASAYANRDKAKARQEELSDQSKLEAMKQKDAAAAEGLLGYNQAAKKLDSALAEAKQVQDNVLAREQELHDSSANIRQMQIDAGMSEDDPKLTQVHVIDPNAGATARAEAEQKARNEYSSRLAELDRKERDERIQAQNEAINSGLEGEALYTAKRSEAIEALTRKYKDGELSMAGYRAIRASTEERFDNEAYARQQKQIDAAQKMLRDSQTAGLTGAARVQAEHDDKVSDINTNRDLDPVAAGIQRQAAAAETTQKLKELDDQFTAHANELAAQRADSALGAYGKVDAAAASQIAALEKDYNASHTAGGGSPEAAQANANAILAIQQDAATKKQEIAQRNAAEDAQYDREAAAAESKVRQAGLGSWVSQHAEAVQSIELQEAQRMAKLAEDAQKEGLTAQEVANRRIDIERQANAEIVEQQEQMQHQIAGVLESAFDNPLKFIKQQGEKMMFEMVAGWIMQLNLFKNVAGSTLGGIHPGMGAGGGGAAGAGAAGSLAQLFGHHAAAGTAGVLSSGIASSGIVSSGITGAGAVAAGYSGTSASPSVVFAGGGGTSSYTGGSSSGGGASSFTASTAPSSVAPAGLTFRGAMGDVSALTNGATSLTRTFGLTTQQASAINAGAAPSSAAANDGSAAGVAPGDDDTADADMLGQTRGGAQAVAASGQLNSLGANANAVGSTELGAGLQVAGEGLAAYQGSMGVFNSFTGTGVKGLVDGTLSGAGAGASIGMLAGGPAGALIGAGVGAAAGFVVSSVGELMDEGNKTEARTYYQKNLLPQLEDLRTHPNTDYLTAVSEANKDSNDAMTYMKAKFGGEAADWVNANYLAKELAATTSQIEMHAGNGGAFSGRNAAEYHTGGLIDNFGDLGTTSTEGFIHALRGEGIVTQPAMAAHGAGVGLMNNGAGAAEMAAHYLALSGAGGGGGSSTVHNHSYDINAIDGKSFGKFLDSGGMEQINKSANRRTALYGGDAVV